MRSLIDPAGVCTTCIERYPPRDWTVNGPKFVVSASARLPACLNFHFRPPAQRAESVAGQICRRNPAPQHLTGETLSSTCSQRQAKAYLTKLVEIGRNLAKLCRCLDIPGKMRTRRTQRVHLPKFGRSRHSFGRLYRTRQNTVESELSSAESGTNLPDRAKFRQYRPNLVEVAEIWSPSGHVGLTRANCGGIEQAKYEATTTGGEAKLKNVPKVSSEGKPALGHN